MKKLSHSFAKVSHSYKIGVALVGMRHIKTAFINILYFCSYCFLNHAMLALFSCVCFNDNRDNRDNFFSYRNFCFNDNRDNFFMCYGRTKPAHKKLSLLSLLSLKTAQGSVVSAFIVLKIDVVFFICKSA